MKRFIVAFTLVLSVVRTSAQEWKAVDGKIATQWASQVTPQKVHSEYPRPQLVRSNWTNLNGLWDYAISNSQPSSYA